MVDQGLDALFNLDRSLLLDIGSRFLEHSVLDLGPNLSYYFQYLPTGKSCCQAALGHLRRLEGANMAQVTSYNTGMLGSR